MREDVIGFFRFNNAVHHSTGLRAFLAAAKHPILSLYHEWTYRILDRIIIDIQTTIFYIANYFKSCRS